MIAKNSPAGRDDDDELLDRPAAAAYLKLAPQTLAADATRHSIGIPYVKMGRAVRYRKGDLRAFVNRHRVDPEAA